MILSVTPTKLQDYLICPLKFKFKHLDKNGGIPSSPAFSFGTSMHRALQKLHSAGNISPQSEDTVKLLERYWERSAYPTKKEEQEYFSKGCRALDNYITEMQEVNEKTLGTEVYMSLLLDLKKTKIRLGCKVDRLALHPDQTLEIIDYKTNRSGKVPTADSLINNLPAFLYYVLTRLTYPQYPNIKLSYLNVLTMEKVSARYEKAIIDENKQALWKCLKEIANNVYLPKSSENCCWCDFQDDCPVTGKVIGFTEL